MLLPISLIVLSLLVVAATAVYVARRRVINEEYRRGGPEPRPDARVGFRHDHSLLGQGPR